MMQLKHHLSCFKIATILISTLALQSCCMRLSQDSNSPCGATPNELTLFQDMATMAPNLNQRKTAELSQAIKEGETLFTGLCSRCHVYTRSSTWAREILQAQDPQAPIPPELTSQRFQKRFSEEYLKATIEYGIHKPFSAHSMPSWKGVLNDNDIRNLVAYIIHIGAPAPMDEAQ